MLQPSAAENFLTRVLQAAIANFKVTSRCKVKDLLVLYAAK